MSCIKGDWINEKNSLSALDGGIDLKKVIPAALVLIALIGLSSAAYTYTSKDILGGKEEINTTFSFEQSVQGNGYFMTYMYAKQGNLAFKNYAHGSGSIDNSYILTTQNLSNKNHGWTTSWNDFVQHCIQFHEDVNEIYAPMRIAVGNGYYAANPIDYSSLLKEKTWVKNYAAATSIHHEIEYAHAIDKQLDVVAKEKFNHTYDPEFVGVAVTQMKINEDVTDGKIHLGVLQGANTNVASVVGADLGAPFSLQTGFINPAVSSKVVSAWKNPAIEIDEDYWGTYHVEKNITLEVPYRITTASEDWLPCCFSGWDSMNPYDQKSFGKSTKGVFDCTCYKTPTQAQFPELTTTATQATSGYSY